MTSNPSEPQERMSRCTCGAPPDSIHEPICELMQPLEPEWHPVFDGEWKFCICANQMAHDETITRYEMAAHATSLNKTARMLKFENATLKRFLEAREAAAKASAKSFTDEIKRLNAALARPEPAAGEKGLLEEAVELLWMCLNHVGWEELSAFADDPDEPLAQCEAIRDFLRRLAAAQQQEESKK